MAKKPKTAAVSVGTLPIPERILSTIKTIGETIGAVFDIASMILSGTRDVIWALVKLAIALLVLLAIAACVVGVISPDRIPMHWLE